MSSGLLAATRLDRPAEPLAGRSLLIDVPNWVGDQVIAMPTVERLLVAAGDSSATLFVREPTRRLWELVFPGTRVTAGPRRANPITSAQRLRTMTGRFDVGVTLRHSSRAKILVRLAARWAVGSRGRGARALLDHRYRVDRSRHQLHDAAPLLASWGLPEIDPGWRLNLPAALLAEGQRRLAAACPAGGPIVGLAPATGCGDAKRWPAERFGALVTRLDHLGCRWVVVVGPGEAGLAAELSRAAGRPLPVLGTDRDVAGLAAIIAGLDLLVGNDSGPMHLAAFQGVPVVAVFGPTDPARTGPVGHGHRVVSRPLACAPCSRDVCPRGHRRCLVEVAVERVAVAVEQAVPLTAAVAQLPLSERRWWRRASWGVAGVSCSSR